MKKKIEEGTVFLSGLGLGALVQGLVGSFSTLSSTQYAIVVVGALTFLGIGISTILRNQ